MITFEIGEVRHNRPAQIAENNSLTVNILEPDLRPFGEKNRYRYFTSLLTDSNNSSDMIVDGSSTPVEFDIRSDDMFDTRITNIVILLADGTIANNKFGALTALTNGVDLEVEEEGLTSSIISGATTGGEIIVQTGLPIPFFSSGVNVIKSFLLNNDALLINIPISQNVPNGIRLGRGSKNRIIFRVNDALAGLTQFNVRAIGYKHFPLNGTFLS